MNTKHILSAQCYNKNGKMMNAKPCPACCQAIKEYGIMNVFYTGSNGCIEQLNMEES